MRKKSNSRRKATPQGEPPALWMAVGSDPGMGKLIWVPVERQ